MPEYNAPIRDYQFVLNEFLRIEEYSDLSGFEDLDIVAPILDEGGKFCKEVLFPLNQTGDKEGLIFKDGDVILPSGFKEAYELYVQGGWGLFSADPEYGGQGLPNVLNIPFTEMVCSTNLSFGLMPGLTHGAYRAIHLHGSEEIKQRYLPKLGEGVWTGIMCLTEAQAGTDLGLIRTTAKPNTDGSYSIEGTKIFISSGEHNASENIVHLILAKLPDAPEGVKGISLFVASKFSINEDGSLGEKNKIVCSGIEHKMGMHASPTCVMNYEGAAAYLVGKPHQGLKAMFTMMNEARIYVGVQGLGLAEAAWQNAFSYANERLQGRALNPSNSPTACGGGRGGHDKPADPITVHPDVRRMLLTMRSFTEGGRVLALWTALNSDIAKIHHDPKTRQDADDFVQLLTPVVKAYLTDGGSEVANLGMQVLGGYGYIKEYGMEQYVRDARIAQIYEGTNGIQSLDLVGRKLGMHNGRYLKSFFHPVSEFIEENKNTIPEFTKPLYQSFKSLQQASLWIAQKGMGNPDEAAGASVEYLKLFGIVAMGYIWAKTAKIALEQLENNTDESGTDEKLFYETKIATARFFLNKILPQHFSLLATITAGVKNMEL